MRTGSSEKKPSRNKPGRARASGGFFHSLVRAWRGTTGPSRMMRFFVRLAVFSLPIAIIAAAGWQWGWLQDATAALSFGMLHLTGLPAERVGELISIPVAGGNWGAVINWDCTAWKSFLALFALVMATEFPLRRKLIGLAVLIPLLFAINILRIVLMFHFVAAFDTAYFDLAHTVIWSWGLIAAIVVLWVGWMRLGLSVRKRL